MKNTGVMCMITVDDANSKDGIKYIDIGNFYIDDDGNRCVVTSEFLAKKYGHLIDCDIYIRKEIK